MIVGKKAEGVSVGLVAEDDGKRLQDGVMMILALTMKMVAMNSRMLKMMMERRRWLGS